MSLKQYEVGNTIKFTWVSSGSSPSTIFSTIISGSETVVSSLTATDSGNGHYFANHPAPSSRGYYVNKWVAQISVNTYVAKQKFEVIDTEVD